MNKDRAIELAMQMIEQGSTPIEVERMFNAITRMSTDVPTGVNSGLQSDRQVRSRNQLQ